MDNMGKLTTATDRRFVRVVATTNRFAIVCLLALIVLLAGAPARAVPTIKRTLTYTGRINGDSILVTGTSYTDVESRHTIANLFCHWPAQTRCRRHYTKQTRDCRRLVDGDSEDFDIADLCNCNYEITTRWIETDADTLTLVQSVSSTVSNDTGLVTATGVWSGTCDEVPDSATLAVGTIYEYWHQLERGHIRMSYTQYDTVSDIPDSIKVIKDLIYSGSKVLPSDEVLVVSNIVAQYDSVSRIEHTEWDEELLMAPVTFDVTQPVYTGAPCCWSFELSENSPSSLAPPMVRVTMEVLSSTVTVKNAWGPGGMSGVISTSGFNTIVTYYMPLPNGLKAGPQTVHACFDNVGSGGLTVIFTAYDAYNNPYYYHSPTCPNPSHPWSDDINFAEAGECACVLPPSKMNLWLPFDESAGLTAKNLRGPDGKLSGGPVWTTDGEVANALMFDGVDDRVTVSNYSGIDIPAHSALLPKAGDFAVDVWVRRDGLSGVRVIVDKRTSVGSDLRGYTFYLYDGRLGVQIADGTWGGWNAPVSSALPIDPVNWHHVAVTVDRDNTSGVLFYIDGQQVPGAYNPTAHKGSLKNAANLLIGERLVEPVGGAAFCGDIDELEIYRRVLSPAEIKAIFDAGRHGKCKKLQVFPIPSMACQGVAYVYASATIINSSVVDRTCNYSFRDLVCGNAPDTLSFLPASGSIVVGAGKSAVVRTRIQIPGAMTSDHIAYYRLTVDDGLLTEEASTYVTIGTEWCASFPDGSVTAKTDSTVNIGPISVTNLGALVDSLHYRICVWDPGDGTFGDDTLYECRLNALDPGMSVEGSAVISAGGTATIPLSATFDDYCPMFPYHVTFAREDTTQSGDPVVEILADMVLMNETESCCIGDRGNVNMTGIVDLSDLSCLVSYLTGGGYVLTCYDAANVNGTGIVDLSDLSCLVSYLTGGGYVLPACP